MTKAGNMRMLSSFVISSELNMVQYRTHDHREDASHFSSSWGLKSFQPIFRQTATQLLWKGLSNWEGFFLGFISVIFAGQFPPLLVGLSYSVQYRSYICRNSTDSLIQGQMFLTSRQWKMSTRLHWILECDVLQKLSFFDDKGKISHCIINFR